MMSKEFNDFFSKYDLHKLDIQYRSSPTAKFGMSYSDPTICKLELDLDSLEKLITNDKLATEINEQYNKELTIRLSNQTVQTAYNEYRMLLKLVDTTGKETT